MATQIRMFTSEELQKICNGYNLCSPQEHNYLIAKQEKKDRSVTIYQVDYEGSHNETPMADFVCSRALIYLAIDMMADFAQTHEEIEAASAFIDLVTHKDGEVIPSTFRKA